MYVEKIENSNLYDIKVFSKANTNLYMIRT